MAGPFKEKLRARQKLTETQFFLKELKRNKNDFDMFQRHLSAFASAWRSVTCVLQKDIKTTLTDTPRANSNELMKWYRKEAEALRALPHAGALLELRNALLHEGSVLPVYQFVLVGLTDEFQKIEVSYDPATSQFIKLGWQIDPSAALRHEALVRLPKPMTAEEAKNAIVENQGKVWEECLKKLIAQFERLNSATKLMIEKKEKVTGYIQVVIDKAGTTMPLDEFITVLEDRTDSLEQLITKAEKRILDPQITSPIP
jgi:hypothetical protein